MDKVYAVSWYETGGVGRHWSKAFERLEDAEPLYEQIRKWNYVYDVQLQTVDRVYYNSVRPLGVDPI